MRFLEGMGSTIFAPELTVQRVKLSEFVGCAWSKPDADKTAPHLSYLSSRFNRVASWVSCKPAAFRLLCVTNSS